MYKNKETKVLTAQLNIYKDIVITVINILPFTGMYLIHIILHKYVNLK